MIEKIKNKMQIIVSIGFVAIMFILIILFIRFIEEAPEKKSFSGLFEEYILNREYEALDDSELFRITRKHFDYTKQYEEAYIEDYEENIFYDETGLRRTRKVTVHNNVYYPYVSALNAKIIKNKYLSELIDTGLVDDVGYEAYDIQNWGSEYIAIKFDDLKYHYVYKCEKEKDIDNLGDIIGLYGGKENLKLIYIGVEYKGTLGEERKICFDFEEDTKFLDLICTIKDKKVVGETDTGFNVTAKSDYENIRMTLYKKDWMEEVSMYFNEEGKLVIGEYVIDTNLGFYEEFLKCIVTEATGYTNKINENIISTGNW